jgi:hypothetical protein
MVHEWMHADVMSISPHSKKYTFNYSNVLTSLLVDDIEDSLSITDPTVYVSINALSK